MGAAGTGHSARRAPGGGPANGNHSGSPPAANTAMAPTSNENPTRIVRSGPSATARVRIPKARSLSKSAAVVGAQAAPTNRAIDRRYLRENDPIRPESAHHAKGHRTPNPSTFARSSIPA